jgi:mono/diheme cytochrome c family protein
MKKYNSATSIAATSLVLLTSSLLLQSGSSKGKQQLKAQSGAQLYMASCEPCHMTGANMINPDKKIINSNKLESEKVFKTFLSQQHAQMPPWRTITRKDADLRALYNFVKKLK